MMAGADYHSMTVDGITSVTRVWIRRIFELIPDHGDCCYVCDRADTEWTWGATKSNMRWLPGDPIVRFTSEGLQVSD